MERERRFASYDHSPHEAKLLALLKAVLSDKSLNKKKRAKLARQPREASLRVLKATMARKVLR